MCIAVCLYIIRAFFCIGIFKWKEKQYFTDIALAMVMVIAKNRKAAVEEKTKKKE